jgi:glutamate dehydrogenase (NAD(P)+)
MHAQGDRDPEERMSEPHALDQTSDLPSEAMEDPWSLADDLGPAKITYVHEPTLGLEAILVVDNLACGPSIEDLRIAPVVSAAECIWLAKRRRTRRRVSRTAAANRCCTATRACRVSGRSDSFDYIFGPDTGTDEACMAWVDDEIGRAVGLPAALGGIPLDELAATAGASGTRRRLLRPIAPRPPRLCSRP